ncbi:MAG: M24 family metallopeptidase [Kiritimatiellia bacterium]
MMKGNPFAARLAAFVAQLQASELDAAVVFDQANVRALTGIDCDNACLLVTARGQIVFHTDFRYVPMVHRVAPGLAVGDIRKLNGARPFRFGRMKFAKIGYESSLAHARYMQLEKSFPGAAFTDVDARVKALRAVKTADELVRIRAAATLNDRIWSAAQKKFRVGMTERGMARVIRRLMIEKGDGEAFETIVCVGANAAECHHVPDDTVWTGREPVLVDMGVRLDGYCSDMTRNLVPPRPTKLYRQVYGLVLQANLAAIAAAKPGMTAGDLDKVARDFLAKNGFGEAFGHSLGHGVGIEIHEAPFVAKKQTTVLVPGMIVTIEPGVYLEGALGVRIEDLVVITETGCEVLSHSAK